MSQTSQGRNIMADGRIVWVLGKTIFQGKPKTDMQTHQPVMDPKTGQQVIEFGFGLAIPKSALGNPQPVTNGAPLWNEIHAEAMTLFPSGQIPPSFAMKYKDGDTAVDERGQPYNKREGYAGHIVISCTTRIPIKFYRHENGANVQVNEGIKCGDYVRVLLQCKAHPAHGVGKAGLYMNPSAVQLLAYGTEIINTPSGDDIFGNMAPPVPAGGTAMPTTPATFPGVPAPVAPPPIAAPPVPTAPPPHHAVLPPAFQPPPGGQVASVAHLAPAHPVQHYQQPPNAYPGYPAAPVAAAPVPNAFPMPPIPR